MSLTTKMCTSSRFVQRYVNFGLLRSFTRCSHTPTPKRPFLWTHTPVSRYGSLYPRDSNLRFWLLFAPWRRLHMDYINKEDSTTYTPPRFHTNIWCESRLTEPGSTVTATIYTGYRALYLITQSAADGRPRRKKTVTMWSDVGAIFFSYMPHAPSPAVAIQTASQCHIRVDARARRWRGCDARRSLGRGAEIR